MLKIRINEVPPILHINEVPHVRTVFNGTESLSFLGPKM